MITITQDEKGYIVTYLSSDEEMSFKYFGTKEEAQAKWDEILESRKLDIEEIKPI